MEPTQAKPAVSVKSNGSRDIQGQERVKAVKALLPFVSKDETRPGLQFVHVTEDGKFCEAVDGHKAMRLPRVDVSPDLQPGAYRVVKDGAGFLLMPDDAGQYPDVQKIIPGPSHKADFYFKASVSQKPNSQGPLLCLFGRAGLSMDADVVGAVPEGQWAFWGTTEFSPVRADRTDKDGWTVVLMPMRLEKVDLTPPKAPETVAEDVAKLNAILAGPTVPGSKEIDPAYVAEVVDPAPDPVEDGAIASPEAVAAVISAVPVPAWIAAMRAAGVRP